MSIKITTTAFPIPPKEYNAEYMSRLVKQMSSAINKQAAIGPITCGSDLTGEAGYKISGLTIIDVPKSPTGLPSGSVWSDSGILKIVS